MPNIQQIDSIRVDLINRCNARCGFCPYHGAKGSVTKLLHTKVEPVSRLELADFKKIICELTDANQFPKFKFSGRGEATIHPHFKKIVELISRGGMALRLISNGVNLFRFTKLLYEHEVVTLVSVHGPEEIHDTVVGVRGAYKKATAAVCSLKNLGCDVSIAMVITPQVLPYIHMFIEEWAMKGVAVRVQHDHGTWRQKMFPADMMEILALKIASMKWVTILPNLHGALLNAYYALDTEMVINPHECHHVLHEVDLRSDGTLYACRSAPFGNIRDTSIVNLISGNPRQEFLNEINNEVANACGLNVEKCDRCCYQSPYSQ